MANFYNQATISFNGNVAGSNITTGRIVETLALTKTALTDTYTPTGEVTYVLSLINSGDTAFTGLTVTDNLGRYTLADTTTEVVPLTYIADTVNVFVNGVQQAGVTVTDTEPLTITGINVPAGGNAVIIYNTRTNQFAPLGADSSVTNTATVDGGGLINPITADETINSSTDPELTISKALDPAVVSENGTITYTFTIRNYGGEEAGADDNVILTDVFDPVLDITAVTFNGTPWVENTDYEYTAGTFTSNNGSITVPPATFTQDPATGAYTVEPGVSTLVITGTIA